MDECDRPLPTMPTSQSKKSNPPDKSLYLRNPFTVPPQLNLDSSTMFYSAAPTPTIPRSLTGFPSPKRHHHSPPRSIPPLASLPIGFHQITDLANNKVLVAATLAAAIGQLSKPLTAALRIGRFDPRALVRSGGMPSTHAASVAAAATSLGLERGFSDPVFGMSVVFAAIVMYDAQGVRREAGYHAKVLNEILKTKKKAAAYQVSKNEELSTSSSFVAMSSLRIDSDKLSEDYLPSKPLNESIGHTEIQVIVGALLGFIVSLGVDIVL